jgi:hypothetical protein
MWPFSSSMPARERESCCSDVEALSERVEKLEHASLERELQLSELLDKVSWRLRQRAAKRIQNTPPDEPLPDTEAEPPVVHSQAGSADGRRFPSRRGW